MTNKFHIPQQIFEKKIFSPVIKSILKKQKNLWKRLEKKKISVFSPQSEIHIRKFSIFKWRDMILLFCFSNESEVTRLVVANGKTHLIKDEIYDDKEKVYVRWRMQLYASVHFFFIFLKTRIHILFFHFVKKKIFFLQEFRQKLFDFTIIIMIYNAKTIAKNNIY